MTEVIGADRDSILDYVCHSSSIELRRHMPILDLLDIRIIFVA
jgi:hypothetical protein